MDVEEFPNCCAIDVILAWPYPFIGDKVQNKAERKELIEEVKRGLKKYMDEKQNIHLVAFDAIQYKIYSKFLNK